MTNLIPFAQTPKCIDCADDAQFTLTTKPRCAFHDRQHNLSTRKMLYDEPQWTPRVETTALRAEMLERSQAAVGRVWTHEDHAELVRTVIVMERLANEMLEGRGA